MIVTTCPPFPVSTRIFKEMEKLRISKHIVDESYHPLGFSTYLDSEVYILGGWWPSAESLVDALRRKGMRVWLLWTPTLLQSEILGSEILYLPKIKHLLEDGSIEYVLCGSRDVAEYFGKRARVIKHPLTPREIPQVEVMKRHIGLFGPTLPSKILNTYPRNILHQLLAFKDTANVIHTGPISQEYKDFAASIGVELIEHPWLPENEFYKLIASMEFGIQCSIPDIEGFSYTVFDFLQMDRPIFSTVDWIWEGLRIGTRHNEIRGLIRPAIPMSLPWMEGGYLRTFAEQLAERHNTSFRATVEELLEMPKITVL